jgi:hypothetical protein
VLWDVEALHLAHQQLPASFSLLPLLQLVSMSVEDHRQELLLIALKLLAVETKNFGFEQFVDLI